MVVGLIRADDHLTTDNWQLTTKKEMKVTEHIENAQGKTLFSFEILPPLKGQNIQSIFDGIDPLMEFKPPFIDVTYHREEYEYKELGN